MKLLVIEDSLRLQRSLVMGLKKAGFKVDATGDGEEGLWYIKSFEYDVVILDLMLPNLDGISILKATRDENIKCSILILSAKDSIQDRVNGLELGADDYLIKPFAFDELLARVNTLIRRKYSVKKKDIIIKNLKIDLNKKAIIRNGVEILFPPREYAVLEYLAINKGRIINRTELEEHIYDENANLMSNVIDAAICNIRKILGEMKKDSIIKTKRGRGFIIEE